jgi:hypothetical protein
VIPQSLPVVLGTSQTWIRLVPGYETADSLAALAIARNASTPSIAAEVITATLTLNTAAPTSRAGKEGRQHEQSPRKR